MSEEEKAKLEKERVRKEKEKAKKEKMLKEPAKLPVDEDDTNVERLRLNKYVNEIIENQ